MDRPSRFLVALVLCLSATLAHAAAPRIGLVLSGGGARGMAHIGVLKVLEEMHIPIHAITATSMGSIVGGAYASGMSVADMEQRVTHTDWKDLFTDEPPRAERPMRRKLDDRRPLLNGQLGYGARGFQLPKGLLNGQKLGFYLRDLISNAENIESFDKLPIPFRAIATNLETGDMKVFDHGDLALAMRASMSVPSAFAPVDIDGHLYVDGGLVRNLPIDVVRQMGVDVVIAVNLGTPLLKREELGSVLGVTAQMIGILTEANVKTSLGEVDPHRDVLILPELGDITAADFDKAAASIAIGEAAARKVAAQLRRFSVPPAEYAAWSDARLTRNPQVARIDEVRIDGLHRVNPIVAEEVLTPKGRPLTRAQLEQRANQLYGSGDYERIDYRVRSENGHEVAIVDAVEKAWGPNYLRFGLGLSAEAEGTASYGLRGSWLSTWVNPLGAEWKTDVQLGSTMLLESSFYQPLQAGGGGFVEPYLSLSRRPLSLYDGDRHVSTYNVNESRLGIDLGYTAGQSFELRAGPYIGQTKADVDVGTTVFPDIEVKDRGLRSVIGWDDVDSLDFPHDGQRATLTVQRSLGVLGADLDYTKVSASWLGATTFQRYTLLGRGLYGDSFGEDQGLFFDDFTLGGFLRLSGYPSERFRGNRFAFGSLVAYRQLDTELAGMPLYLGGSLETGKVWSDDAIPLDTGGTHSSASLFFGADTLLGPTYLGFGISEEGDTNVYFMLGRPW
ncbi:patatin-like phospholipase family protein [Plasticicumulans acidivorans]|uniref:NTE family protein n=1 Tax=Plasticicumulans acidivorans TaxID=886464 RepID=A0A317N1P1_9GAMM|nr:patatin-like phospholipase family protein [Plasticicumulans acidivorans]PWV65828.1 NTE family protein [Plasticicumulans acidivorans]